MAKKFDAVAWMRERRTQIDKEDQSLSWEERAKKTRKVIENDPLWQRLQKHAVETVSPIWC